VKLEFHGAKVGSILKLLTNDIQGGKIQSGKEELKGK
jgi:hypothetical protein